MIQDFREHDSKQPLHADVCIVGAGPVGLSMAAEFATASERSVLVLEAGGWQPGAVAPRAAYESIGLPYSMDGTRRQAIGGTSHAWDAGRGALMRPFETIDFVERDWVEASGWPFTADELLHHYRRAAETVELPAATQDVVESQAGLLGLPFTSGRLRNVPIYHVSPKYFSGSPLKHSDRVQLWHHAEVLELRTDPAGARVVEALVRHGTGGGPTAVTADTFVIAGGAVENARLLLASNSGSGIGNRHGHVGRYFMEHPKGEFGLFIPTPEVSRQLDAYAVHPREGVSVRFHVYLSEQAIRANRILGMYAALWPTEPDWLSDDLRDLATRALDAYGRNAPLYALSFQAEQAPHPENRVTLERDNSGQETVRLSWTLSSLEYRTLVRGAQIIQEEFQLLRAGVVLTKPYLDHTGGYAWNRWRGDPYPIKTSHHAMGTTRMHRSPEKGVVDAQCKVHGVDNLFAAGGSVFPTGSHMNPTFTAVALAIRLVRHLMDREH